MSQDAILRRALEVKEKFVVRLKAYPNVTGVGVGYKVFKGCRTDEICLRVYVKKKFPRQELRPEEVLPEEVLPERVEGIPVDVIEATFRILLALPAPPREAHRRRHNPLVGGISIGNSALGGSGTLGVSVFDNESGEDMMFSVAVWIAP